MYRDCSSLVAYLACSQVTGPSLYHMHKLQGPATGHSEGPATGHLDTGFSWFPCVYKQILRWFPRFQVATAFIYKYPPTWCTKFYNKFIFKPLHVSSTMCSSSGGQKLYYTVSGIITLKQFLPSWRWAHVLETCRGLKINLL